MIKRFLPTETTYNHNKYILKPLRAEVVEEANGMFELEIELPKGTQLNKRDIITAPTPRGVQPFRVYRITKTLQGIKAYARHIFYDLANALLLDVRPTNRNASGALQSIFDAVGWSGWSYLSDITELRTAYYIRKNPVEAIIGAENSILNTWGGNLIRNGKEVRINASGVDRGYEIRLGKNLIGIEDDSDDSNVVTRLYPTFERNQVIYGIPEGYVDSPLVGNYPTPISREVRVALTEEQQELPDAQIHSILRAYCNNLYNIDNVDKPVMNYKIDFVELSKVARMAQERKYTYAGLEQLTYQTLSTLTYGELESVNVIEQFTDLLEKVDLYDLVKIKVKELDIDLQAKVISYRYDCLGERYAKLELGGFKPSNQYQIGNLVQQIKNDRDKASDEFRELYDLAINKVTGNAGGYQITRRNANDEPYETLWMDTPDIQTAQKVLRINQNGIAGSANGFNGPYNVAITTDGWIVAERIQAINLSAITSDVGELTAGLIRSEDGTSYWNLSTGEMNLNVNSLKINSKDVASQDYVQDEINALNQANANLVSNLSDNWEQGDIDSAGSMVASDNHIRTKGFYPVRQGHVYFKISPLYLAKIIVYDQGYNFSSVSILAGEGTFLLTANAYFKVVVQRTNSTAITPDAINTAELKVENSETPTKFTPYFGDLTLDAIQDYFILNVTSTRGWSVDIPNYSTTLEAKIYLYNEDVTHRFENSQFTWFKQYPNNTLVSLGVGKTKTIASADIEKTVTIICEFEIYDTIYTLATYGGDGILTMANDLIQVIGYQ